MDSHIYGFTLQELNFPFAVTEYSDTAQSYLAQISAHAYPYFSHLARLVAEGGYRGVHDFDFGLELILSGLERYRKKS
jgi:hypothetical protein